MREETVGKRDEKLETIFEEQGGSEQYQLRHGWRPRQL